MVGIVGAVLGGWFLSPLIGVSTINQSNFSVAGLLVSFLGAVILLAIVNLVRRVHYGNASQVHSGSAPTQRTPAPKLPEINVETFKGVVQSSDFVSSREDIGTAMRLPRAVNGCRIGQSDMQFK